MRNYAPDSKERSSSDLNARMHEPVRRKRWIGSTSAALVAVTMAAVCAVASAAAPPPRFMPLDISRLNLIFVPTADTDPATGLMTARGLQRSLRLGAWLGKIMVSVGDIHAAAPTTAAGRSPDAYDLNAVESIEQLALEFDAPIDASAPAQCGSPCPSQGLDAADIGNPNGDNEALVEGIIATAQRYHLAGNHVFSLPAALLNNLLGYVNAAEKYHLKIPPLKPDQHNSVYVVSIDHANRAALTIYNFPISPPSAYPKIVLPKASTCPQTQVRISTRAMGLKPPHDINVNETVYLVRHVEAHPNYQFENGNYVCRGQWRALGAPAILYRKITASSGGHLPHNFEVYGPDPSYPAGVNRDSYVRAALTVNPFAIAYGLPMHLARGVDWRERSSEENAAIHFFFTRPAAASARSGFSNSTLLIGWEHDNLRLMVQDLLNEYYRPGQSNAARLPPWDSNDYDSIWIMSLDAKGNLTFTNQCEGVPSASLRIACPSFE